MMMLMLGTHECKLQESRTWTQDPRFSPVAAAGKREISFCPRSEGGRTEVDYRHIQSPMELGVVVRVNNILIRKYTL